MSAPARLMPVRISSTARALVDPALRAAALTMANSPLTLYAATGTPKRSLTRRMMSRYGQGRLDHDDVGPFGQVERDLAQGLVAVGRVHLVAAAVAELRRRFGGVAERTVECPRRTWPRSS